MFRQPFVVEWKNAWSTRLNISHDFRKIHIGSLSIRFLRRAIEWIIDYKKLYTSMLDIATSHWPTCRHPAQYYCAGDRPIYYLPPGSVTYPDRLLSFCNPEYTWRCFVCVCATPAIEPRVAMPSCLFTKPGQILFFALSICWYQISGDRAEVCY